MKELVEKTTEIKISREKGPNRTLRPMHSTHPREQGIKQYKYIDVKQLRNKMKDDDMDNAMRWTTNKSDPHRKLI